MTSLEFFVDVFVFFNRCNPVKHLTPLEEIQKKELKKGNDFGGFFVLTRPPPKEEVNGIGLFGPEFSTHQFKVVFGCQPFWLNDILGKWFQTFVLFIL